MSVVVPTHDTRELTLRCVASLAPLAARGSEVILVDDGSVDGTAQAVTRAFDWVRVLVNEIPQRFTRSANRGLNEARGDILLLLNSDTEVDAAALDPLFEAFATDKKLGACGASLTYPDGTPQWSGGRLPTRAWLTALASGVPALLGALPGYRRLRRPSGAGGGAVDWVTGAAIAIRRDAWTQVGPLDESFAFYGQDLDFCHRLRRAGWHVRLVPGWRVMHVGGATIGRRPGAIGGAHPALLWSDLLLWTSRSRGAAWTARTARLMRAAASARIAARWLWRPFRGASREGWDRDTAALRQARAAARAWSDGVPPP